MADAPQSAPLRVLVIDDERNIRSTLAMCLEGMGCKVAQASSRTTALAALHSDPFDLAFLDGLKAEYADQLDRIVALMRPGGLIAVDNILMSGGVAEGRAIDGWSSDRIATARAFNDHLVNHPDLIATLTPVGDGLALAVRR